MIVLGISALDKESTVAILRDGRLTFALSEERLSRDKQQGGVPRLSLRAALDFEGLQPRQIDARRLSVPRRVRSEVVQVISLASTSLALSQGWASESMNCQLRRHVEGDWPLLDAAIATHTYGFTLMGRKPLRSPLPPARVHLFDEES